MVYSLPPAPPPMVHVASAPIPTITIMAATECKRGSRECFPTDRVGYQPSDWAVDRIPGPTTGFTLS